MLLQVLAGCHWHPCRNFSADLMRRFIAAENEITEIMQPVTMPTSSLCHSVVKSPQVKRMQKLSQLHCKSFWKRSGTWQVFNIKSTNLRGIVPYAFVKSSHRTARSPWLFFASSLILVIMLVQCFCGLVVEHCVSWDGWFCWFNELPKLQGAVFHYYKVTIDNRAQT